MGEDGIWHGGDLGRAQALFPSAPAPWIDLSTGINPVPYPLPEIPPALWRRLPAAADEQRLLDAARRAYGVAEQDDIVAAPGTQILIELLPRLAPAGPVAVLGPTYAEHAHAWSKAGYAVTETNLPDAGEAATIVVVSPNNPDGRVLGQTALERLATICAARGGLLVVDEAFCDFTHEASFVPERPLATVILRSFGKTYGLAGLRLGFAIGAPEAMQRLREALGPWSVAGPALYVGAEALANDLWLAEAAAARATDAHRLDALLLNHGEVAGGATLFRLLICNHAPALFGHLGRAGIFVRRFRENDTRLRFGLPGDATEWARLEAALRSFEPALPASA